MYRNPGKLSPHLENRVFLLVTCERGKLTGKRDVLLLVCCHHFECHKIIGRIAFFKIFVSFLVCLYEEMKRKENQFS